MTSFLPHPWVHHKNFLALLMALALGLVIGAHHVDFLNANPTELALGARLWRSVLWGWSGLLLLGVLLRLLLWRLPLWVVWAALIPVAYLGFSYHELHAALGLLDPPTPEDPIKQLAASQIPASQASATAFEFAQRRLLVGSLILLSVLALMVWRVRTARAAWSLFAAASVVTLVALGRWGLQSQTATAAPQETHADAALDMSTWPTLLERPNIYWLVADAYPAFDLLKRDFGFDAQPFVQWLEQQGFAVNTKTWANYPSTINSISSTLSGTYVLDPQTPSEHVRDLTWLRERVRGRNAVVTALRAQGYRYTHFSSGYDLLSLCMGFEDRCLTGAHVLDEIDVALLRRTPLLDAGLLWQRHFSSDMPPYAHGSFDAVLEKLPAAFEVPAPYFMYAHVVAPHPPMRLTRECAHQTLSFDLRSWKTTQRGAFAEQVECVNTQLRTLIERITQRDPSAVIVLQSDHGSAFHGQFARTDDVQWNADDIEERFRVLNAIRAPQRCQASLATQRSLVNTYPLLFACLAQQPARVQPDRMFLVPYDNSPNFGRVIEIARPSSQEAP